MSQSKIQDVKVVPHVSAVGYASERQHPELDSETKYYLRNRLIVVTGDLVESMPRRLCESTGERHEMGRGLRLTPG